MSIVAGSLVNAGGRLRWSRLPHFTEDAIVCASLCAMQVNSIEDCTAEKALVASVVPEILSAAEADAVYVATFYTR